LSEEPFQVPVPPPFLPPGDRDVVYFTQRVGEGGGGADREDEDILLRRVPSPVAQRYRAAAGARGMTHAQYLAALVALHESIRARADGGDAELAAELERLNLSTVSV
jgi:hypothetical protein